MHKKAQKTPKTTKNHQKPPRVQKARKRQKRNQGKVQNTNKPTKIKNALKKYLWR